MFFQRNARGEAFNPTAGAGRIYTESSAGRSTRFQRKPQTGQESLSRRSSFQRSAQRKAAPSRRERSFNATAQRSGLRHRRRSRPSTQAPRLPVTLVQPLENHRNVAFNTSTRAQERLSRVVEHHHLPSTQAHERPCRPTTWASSTGTSFNASGQRGTARQPPTPIQVLGRIVGSGTGNPTSLDRMHPPMERAVSPAGAPSTQAITRADERLRVLSFIQRKTPWCTCEKSQRRSSTLSTQAQQVARSTASTRDAPWEVPRHGFTAFSFQRNGVVAGSGSTFNASTTGDRGAPAGLSSAQSLSTQAPRSLVAHPRRGLEDHRRRRVLSTQAPRSPSSTDNWLW